MEQEYIDVRATVTELEFLVNIARTSPDREVFKKIKKKLKEIKRKSKAFEKALFLSETGFYKMIGEDPPEFESLDEA